MLEKRVLDAILRRVARGGVAIRYWDGETRRYGPDQPYFTALISGPGTVRAMLMNMTLGFGEAYMDGSVDIEGR